MALTLDEIGIKYAYNFGKGKQYVGGDKTSLGKNFTKIYEELFNQIKHNKINLLELGIFHGKSLAMWSDYFYNGQIISIDIDLKPFYENEQTLKKYGAFKNNNIKVIEQDITKIIFADTIKNLPNLDIIINDALNHANAQYNNFKLLFSKLNKNGYYIIEDVIDPIHHIELFKNIYACTTNSEIPNTKKLSDYSIANKIESILIKNNIVIIKKKN